MGTRLHSRVQTWVTDQHRLIIRAQCGLSFPICKMRTQRSQKPLRMSEARAAQPDLDPQWVPASLKPRTKVRRVRQSFMSACPEAKSIGFEELRIHLGAAGYR